MGCSGEGVGVVGIKGIHFMTEIMLYGLEELQNNGDYTSNQARGHRPDSGGGGGQKGKTVV